MIEHADFSSEIRTDDSSERLSTSSSDADLDNVLNTSLTRMYERLGIGSEMSGSRLCANCFAVMALVRKFQESNVTFNTGHVKHFQSYSTVERAADGGCVLCAAFVTSTAYTSRFGLPGVVSVEFSSLDQQCSFVFIHDAPGGDVSEDIAFFDTVEQQPVLPSETIKDPGGSSLYQVREVRFQETANPELRNDTHESTEDALVLCKVWLRHCELHHKTCRQTSRRLPTRLVEVGDTTARLCLQAEVQDRAAEYATLSHCWGAWKFLTLTTQNLDEFHRRIPLEALTKTFREAIRVTRYLGIKYIWIDSLCIVQDSHEDWRKESALMASVYGNATVNLAATSAVDGRDGLFFKRRNNWRHQVRLKNESQSGIDAFDCLPWDWDVATSYPLTKRAWVVQERCLSQRTIHFTERQVFWECNGGHYCEANPGSHYRPGPHEPTPNYTIERFAMQRRPLTMETWCHVLQTYTACKLTKKTDKLAAIAGFAKAVRRSLKGPKRYVAGMWETDLLSQLTWRVHEPGCRETAITSPSWSWSSVDAVVEGYFHGDPEVVYFDPLPGQKPKGAVAVESLRVDYLSPTDVFGSVVSAVLRLRCEYLYRGTVKPFRSKPRGFFKYDFECIKDAQETLRTLDIRWDLCAFSPEASSEPVPVYLFPIETHEVRDRKESSAQGLVLQPSCGQGQYERVGYYEVDDYYMDQYVYPPSSRGEMPPSYIGGFPLAELCYKGSKELFDIADCIQNREDTYFSDIRQGVDGEMVYHVDLV